LSYKNFLFDLFYIAYLKVYNNECKKNITTFIGPPIGQVLTAINGETNLEIIKFFINEFKQHYDTEGLQKV